MNIVCFNFDLEQKISPKSGIPLKMSRRHMHENRLGNISKDYDIRGKSVDPIRVLSVYVGISRVEPFKPIRNLSCVECTPLRHT